MSKAAYRAPSARSIYDDRPKKEAPLLEHRLDRHDRTQLELKLGYGLRPQSQRQAYRIDTYVFVPKVLSLTSHNYGPERFYADSTTCSTSETPLP